VDIIFHPASSIVAPGWSRQSSEKEKYDPCYPFHIAHCILAPPPNPFRYPPTAATIAPPTQYHISRCDVHCYIDVYEEELSTLQRLRGQDSNDAYFTPALLTHLKQVLGSRVSTCTVRGPQSFPFASELDICHYTARRAKKNDAYATGDVAIRGLHKPHVTDFTVTLTSFQSLKSILQPVQHLEALSLLVDVSPTETQADAEQAVGDCAPYLSQQKLKVLSVGYFHDDDNNDTSTHHHAYHSPTDASALFLTSIIRKLPFVQHLALTPVATNDHIAPLLQAALSRNLQSLSFPLADITGYLRQMSTQRDVFTAMSSTVNCLVITGYDMELMTVPYVCHLIRFFTNITTLKTLVFDIGDECNDDSDIEFVADVVNEAKSLTVDNRIETQLDVFLDFET
jgi:hypothetical protein